MVISASMNSPAGGESHGGLAERPEKTRRACKGSGNDLRLGRRTG